MALSFATDLLQSPTQDICCDDKTNATVWQQSHGTQQNTDVTWQFNKFLKKPKQQNNKPYWYLISF